MPMMLGGAMMAGSGALGGLGAMFGSRGAKKQLALMREALDYQKGIDKRNFEYQQGIDKRSYGDLGAYRDFGGDQLNQLGAFMRDKNPSNYMDPGYAFRLKGGSDAIMGNAAAQGMLGSGDTLRALTQYGQDMGSQEYGNAFNRWLGEGQFRQGLAGMGQTAAVQGGQLANQGAATITQGGNQAAANISKTSADMDAGASDRIWGNFLGGIGGGMMGGAAGMMPTGMKLGGANIFSSMKGPGFGAAQEPYSWAKDWKM